MPGSAQKKTRILHVEDSELDSELVAAILRRDGLIFELVRVQTRQEFFNQVQAQPFDVVLSDCSLPRFSGLEALNLSHTLQPEVPFIFFSGTIGEETAVESLRHGAYDYVLKDRAGRLAPSIRRALVEVTQRRTVVELRKNLGRTGNRPSEELLVSGIAHHFNNILTIILGHSALLAKYSTSPDRVLNTASTIEEAANRGALIVRHLMAMVGQQGLEFARVDLNDRVQRLVAQRSAFMPENLTVSLDLAPDLPSIYVDGEHFEKVFGNVLQNAFDAMWDRGGDITIATRLISGQSVKNCLALGLSDDSSYLCLEVEDGGVGATEEELLRVFDPFYTTKPKHQGLGLSVAQGLMKAHRGAITLESRPMEGARACLYFPITDSSQPVLSPADRNPTRKSLSGTEAILVVEDEPQLLSFMGIILRGQGYRPILARDSAEAIEAFRTHQEEIRLVVSDVGLPGMDGFSLIAELQKLAPSIPTIVVSGNLETTYQQTIDKLGVRQFLSKPYRTNEILLSIRNVLDESPPPRPYRALDDPEVE